MTPLWESPEVVAPFVARIIGTRPDFGNCQTMAILDKSGKMVAGLVFHSWNPDAGVIEVAAAALTPKWATRNVLKTALAYCFQTAGCQMVVARHAEDNTAARRLWKALGADEMIIPRLRGRTASEAIALLTDDAWAQSKFMRSSDEPRQIKSASAA